MCVCALYACVCVAVLDVVLVSETINTHAPYKKGVGLTKMWVGHVPGGPRGVGG